MKRNEYDYTKVYPNRTQPFKIYDDYIDNYGNHILKIRFEDENVKGEHTELEINRRRLSGKDPFVKDPYQPSICNTCAIGKTRARTEDGSAMKPEYNLYTSIVNQCYNDPYSDAEIADEWKCFEDFERTLPEVEGYNLWKNNARQYQLDKNTNQQNINHKIYSKDTCAFVPIDRITIRCKPSAKRANNLPCGVFQNGRINESYIAKYNNKHIGTYSDPVVAGYAVALYAEGHGKNANSYFNDLPRTPSFDELVDTRVTNKNDRSMYTLYAPNKDIDYDNKFNK